MLVQIMQVPSGLLVGPCSDNSLMQVRKLSIHCLPKVFVVHTRDVVIMQSVTCLVNVPVTLGQSCMGFACIWYSQQVGNSQDDVAPVVAATAGSGGEHLYGQVA